MHGRSCVVLLLASLFGLAQSALAQELTPQYPLAVAAAKDGTIYLADRNLPGIWKVVDGKPSLYFQASKKFRTPLNAVRCLAIDGDSKLLAGDSATREVYRFDDAGQPQPLTKGGVGIPMALAVDDKGNIWAADLEIHRIVRIPAEGGEAEIVAEVAAPRGLAFDSKGALWIVSQGQDQLLRLKADAKESEVVVAGQPFSFPHQVVVDDAGVAYVTDGYAKAVWKIAPSAAPEKLVEGQPLDNPVGIARSGERLLVIDPRANSLFTITPAGELTATKLGPPLP